MGACDYSHAVSPLAISLLGMAGLILVAVASMLCEPRLLVKSLMMEWLALQVAAVLSLTIDNALSYYEVRFS